MTEHKNIILDYLRFLESGDIENVLSLFSDDAVVHSPLYGDLPAEKFYNDLGGTTENSAITFKQYFKGDHKNSAAVNFKYDWTLINGEQVTFNCVDLFEFNSNGKITELFIIYDTYPIRNEFQNAQNKQVTGAS